MATNQASGCFCQHPLLRSIEASAGDLFDLLAASERRDALVQKTITECKTLRTLGADVTLVDQLQDNLLALQESRFSPGDSRTKRYGRALETLAALDTILAPVAR